MLTLPALRRLPPRRLALCAAALVAWLAVAAGTAGAAERTYTLRSGPFRIAAFETRLPKLSVPHPPRDGFITRMHARLVDNRGHLVTLRRVMLHHVVFSNLSSTSPGGHCPTRGQEAFYGTGEENQSLDLPPGYGYRLRHGDRWRMHAMLMSHSRQARNVHVEYRVTVESRRLRAVRPFWIRASGCALSGSYSVPGGGLPGSIADNRERWRVPFDGRIVAAGGHLHGGAIDLRLTQPRCGDRVLFHNHPAFGAPNHLFYRVRPVLHEIGPIATSWFSSRTGIPVHRGETLDLHGLYDGEHPHAGVMAITHLYLAPGRVPRRSCPRLPADLRQSPPPPGSRTSPPWVLVPLSTLDDHGRIVTLAELRGRMRSLRSGATIAIRDRGFTPSNTTIERGASLRFRWAGRAEHNLKFANGPTPTGSGVRPRGSIDPHRFTVPGRYQFFCSRHPLTMHAQVTVRG